MNSYIATFYSHYDAMTFFNFLKDKNITAKLMPVPRKISASCGTCVSFVCDLKADFSDYEIQAIYIETKDGGFKDLSQIKSVDSEG